MDFKKNEIYSRITLPNKPFFIRLDGWGFHQLSKKAKLKKPFDKNFSEAMAKTAKQFFIPFNPCLAYVFSDEINLLFLQASSFKRVEKIDSVFAGIASSFFSKEIRQNATFDCRCIPIEKKDISKYLVWRQAEAFRNFSNGYAQYLLQTKEKLSPKAAAKKLQGIKTEKLAAIRKKYRVKAPEWHERGILLYRQEYKKKGYDPIRKKKVLVERSKVIEDWKPPIFSKNKKFVERLIRQ
jgi:tRNA(His) 5'-end guanylyltransferase